MTLIEASRELARKAHDGQTRRDKKTPYFDHVEDVAKRVERYCESVSLKKDVLVSAAYLHDVLEDTDYDENDVWDYLTTNAPNSEEDTRHVICYIKSLTKELETDYFDYVRNLYMMQKNIKIADILSNLSDNPTRKQTKKYAKALSILLDY